MIKEFSNEFGIIRNSTHKMQVQAANREEQHLIDALQEHLGRLIVTSDFKHCQMKYFQDKPDQYIFAYKGYDLGLVKKEFKIGWDNGDIRNDMYSMIYEISFHPLNIVKL